ncbi:hypothetical protein EMIT0P100_310002 [Pseudomonas sp. IT-P100]|uniref:hypothetical protein n=1 Tax=Pseudomonas sp. IT-P100 TaxID=3026452 RepID=UPI0039E102C6
MGLGRNQLAIVIEGANERVVSSAVSINLGDVVAQDKPTRIIADQIIVTGLAETKGHSLSIFCRELIFQDGGRISTNGLPGLPTFPAELRKESPHSPGSDGLEGDDGGNGQAAGDVTIAAMQLTGELSITAVGGEGGRPQDGGHGRQGVAGADGKFVTLPEGTPIPPECNGGPGAAGGKAGVPGRRGAGGVGGQIKLSVLGRAVIDTQGVICTHGLHAPAGQPGSFGAGGPEGKPGGVDFQTCIDDTTGPRSSIQLVDLQQNPHFEVAFSLYKSAASLGVLRIIRDCYLTSSASGAPGAQGPAGDGRLADVEQRQMEPVGKDGNLHLSQISTENFAVLFDGPSLEILACGVEDSYRSSGNATTPLLKQQIEFLLTICVDDPRPSALKKDVMGRVYSMARKINLNLDFYGYTLERAPLLSFDTYSRLINDHVLQQADQVEKSFNAYWDAAENKEKQRVQLQIAVSAARGRVLALELEFDRIKDETKDLLAKIPGLDDKVVAAEAVLNFAKQKLDEAIRNKANGCDLAGTLIAVSTIVSGVATGGAGFIAAASAGAKLYGDYTSHDDSIAQLWDSRKLIQDDLTVISKGAGDVSKGIAAIQEGMQKLDKTRPRVPQFIMEREEFDKVAKEFTGMEEAEEYREAGYDFLKSVEARNSAILNYNSMLVQLVEMQSQVATSDRAVDIIQSNLSAQADPAEANVVSVMSRVYLDTLTIAAQMVHAEKKALAYTFARPVDAPLSAMNVATISIAHQKAVSRDWVAAKERYEARRHLQPGQLDLDLRLLVSAVNWDIFKESHVLSFTIRKDHPKYSVVWEYLPAVRVTGIELVLDGAKIAVGMTQIPWAMTQGGSEIIYRSNANPVAFNHRPVTFRGFTSLVGDEPIVKPDFSENDLYAGLSPFASWLLALSLNPSLGLNLEDLKSATLRLSGYFIDG